MQIALQNPRLGRLLAALATSCLGDWLYNLALLAYVEQRTHSTTWLGLTTAARVTPMVIAGPLGGLLADRFDRRRLMICADVARAGLMGLLVLVAVAGLPVLLVPVLAAAATLAAVPYPPCVAAVTPRLVPEDRLAAANAARAVIAPACVAAGPALGALLLLLGSPSVAFAINAITFVLSGVLVSLIPRAGLSDAPGDTPAQDPTPASWLHELRQGARALLTVPEAGRMVSADVAGSFVYGAQTVLLLLVAGRLGLGAAGYGYLLAAQGAGGILGAAAAGRLGDRVSRRPALVGGLILVAAPLPLLAITTSLVAALALGAVAGAGALLVEVVADTRLQQTLPPERLGCAYGFAFAASVGAIAVGSLVAPALVAVAGVSGSLIAIGIAVAALAAVIALRGNGREIAAPAPAGA